MADVCINTMRSKNFLILLLFILATTISVWLVNLPSPNIHNIMSETHKKISNLKNINVMSDADRFNVDGTYLELLGFNKNPKLYPNDVDKKETLPVVVTGVTSHDYENAVPLLKSVRKYLHSHKMVIYDIGMGTYELLQVRRLSRYINIQTLCIEKDSYMDAI